MKKSAAAYQQVGLDLRVETADPHTLIVMLFDGATAALATAKYAMESGNIASKGASISKAIDIISNGLDASLDVEQGGELAERLSALYDYMASRLLWANLKNDMSALQEVQGLLSELADAWRQIAPKP
ncbi:flagellar export chaperone FliS [Thauera sp.]|uniref:flagellar export chaperone FliS n=1 Tax=Thauera sp. TaxID=1905334 RepID=UPI00338F20D6